MLKTSVALSNSGYDDFNFVSAIVNTNDVLGFCGGLLVSGFRIRFHEDNPETSGSRDPGFEYAMVPGIHVTEDEEKALLSTLATKVLERAAEDGRYVLVFFNGDEKAQTHDREYMENAGNISFDKLIKNLGGHVVHTAENPKTSNDVNMWVAEVADDPRIAELENDMMDDYDEDNEFWI